VLALFFPAVGIGGAVMAMAVAGELKETTTPEHHKVRDVNEALTYMDESYKTPLDQMLRRAKSRQKRAKNVMVEFVRVDRTPPRVDTAGGAATVNATATTNIAVDNVQMWRANDLVYLADGKILNVESVNIGAGTIGVRYLPRKDAGNKEVFTTGTASVASGGVLTRITTSKTEFDSPSDSRIVVPQYDFNFVHSFDALVAASTHRQLTANYTEGDWGRAQSTSEIDMRRSAEYAMFFSERSVTTGDNGQDRWTMAGLTRFINQTLDYTIDELDEKTLMSWTRQIFTGNSGSRERILFADAHLAEQLDYVMLTKLNHDEKRTIAGVETRVVDTRFGKLFVVHHPGFDELKKEQYGVVVDLANVFKTIFEPVNRELIDLKKIGQRDGKAHWWNEKFTLEVHNPDTHFLIQGDA